MSLSRPTSTAFWFLWHFLAVVTVSLICSQLEARWNLAAGGRTFFIGMVMSYCLSVIALMFYIPKGGKIRFVELIAICLSIFGSFFLFLILRQLNYSRAMVIVTLSILAAFGILSLSLKATLEKPAIKVVTVLVAVMLLVGVANAIRSGQLIGIPIERLNVLIGKGPTTGPVTEHKLIRTSFYKLAATYNRDLLVEQVTGGAISIFGDRYLLATGDGDLHALSWNPEKKKLDTVSCRIKFL